MFRLISILCLFGLSLVCTAQTQGPKSRRPIPVFKTQADAGLNLPNNATSIRENIVDTFSCQGRVYGYYADMDNECQIFHVCLPQARGAIRWSFICPAETVFNQATFVCTRSENSIPCEESEQFYILNEDIGKEEQNTEQPLQPSVPDAEQVPAGPYNRRTSRIFAREWPKETTPKP